MAFLRQRLTQDVFSEYSIVLVLRRSISGFSRLEAMVTMNVNDFPDSAIRTRCEVP